MAKIAMSNALNIKLIFPMHTDRVRWSEADPAMNVNNSIFIILNFNPPSLWELITENLTLMGSSIKLHMFIKVVLKATSITFVRFVFSEPTQRPTAVIPQKSVCLVATSKVGQFRTELDYIQIEWIRENVRWNIKDTSSAAEWRIIWIWSSRLRVYGTPYIRCNENIYANICVCTHAQHYFNATICTAHWKSLTCMHRSRSTFANGLFCLSTNH